MKKSFFFYSPIKEVKIIRQIRIVGSILVVMLLLSACANVPDEEMVIPLLDVTVEMLSGTENDNANTDIIVRV